MLDKYYGLDCANFYGYQVIAVPYMMDIVQARTHKKKRINKKWRRRYGVKEVPWNKFVIEGNRIYCHPKLFDKVKAELEVEIGSGRFEV